mgnify:FL=1
MFSLLFASLVATSTVPVDAWWAEAPAASARLRAAREALEAERPRAALAATASTSDDPAARWLRARALAALDRPDEALRALEPLGEPRPLDPEDDAPRLAMGRLIAELRRDDPSARAEVLAALGTAEHLDEAFSLAPSGSTRRRDRLLRLIREHPAAPETKRRLETWGLGRLAEELPAPEASELALALLDGHANEPARDLAARLLDHPGVDPALTCKLRYIVGKADRKRRRYRVALRELNRALDSCVEVPQPTLAMKSGLLAARVLGILGRPAEIDDLFERLVELSPGHSYLDDVRLYAAEASRGRAARRRFSAVAEMNGDQAPRAAWRLAWRAMRRGREAYARRLLQGILSMSAADRDDTERAEYHLARLDTATSTQAGASGFEALARRPSFYGFLAQRRLAELDPGRARGVRGALLRAAESPDALLVDGAVLDDPRVRRARRWYHAGLPEWARAELLAAAGVSTRESTATALTYAALFRAAGDLPRASRRVRWRPELLGALTPETVGAWRLAYPRAFEAELAEATGAAGLDPLLLTALSREESVFDPDIVSWAGATGLTQLMPATAIGAHADLFPGAPPLDLARLADPALNLRLGAHVLAENLRFFDGCEAFALSAYNGGAGLTEGTFRRRRLDFEDWVESNPVKENRGYVKRVLATWGIYRLLYPPHRATGPRMPRSVGPGARVRWPPGAEATKGATTADAETSSAE